MRASDVAARAYAQLLAERHPGVRFVPVPHEGGQVIDLAARRDLREGGAPDERPVLERGVGVAA
jgi:hypothetical protein